MANKTLSLTNALYAYLVEHSVREPEILQRLRAETEQDRMSMMRIAPALATLDELIESGKAGSFDFAFIDADKVNYLGYYERALTLVRSGGLIAVDNTLWGGQVIDKKSNSEDTQAIRRFNDRLYSDSRVQLSLLPIGDGLTLALKL